MNSRSCGYLTINYPSNVMKKKRIDWYTKRHRDMRYHLGLGEVKDEDVPEDIVEVVAETIKTKSTTLKISKDAKKVVRTTKLQKPEEVIEQLDSRTTDASPIAYDTTLEELETFFNQSTKCEQEEAKEEE
nr:la protein 1 [Tanacetum cinerariifolium]